MSVGQKRSGDAMEGDTLKRIKGASAGSTAGAAGLDTPSAHGMGEVRISWLRQSS